MDIIFHRISVRKYKDKPVEEEKIKSILKAAMQAPSATNQQPWEFYVVTNKDKLKELSQVSPYAKMTATAPVAIVSAYRKVCTIPEYAQIDLSIATKRPDNPSAGVAKQVKFKLYSLVNSSHFSLMCFMISNPNF